MNRDPGLVLGVLTGDGNRHSPYVRSLIRVARECGLLAYSFTPQQVLSASGGLLPLSDFPLPDVVYNRIPTRKEEAAPVTRRCKSALHAEGIAYFNEGFLNKREIDEALRRFDDTEDLLPVTRTRPTETEVADMLDRFGSLFVKPVSGSFGEGICRLARDGSQFHVKHRQLQGVVTKSFNTLSEALLACRSHMGAVDFLVQEEVELMSYEGRKTDFRLHVHRSGEPDWDVVALGAKVAHPEALTTHVHSGGYVESGDVVLAHWFGARLDEARERLKTAGCRACVRMAQTLDPHLGELGLDMGIAKDGRIVLFEANAKPGRAIFQHRSLRAAGQASRIRLFEYAACLMERGGANRRMGAIGR